MHRRSRPCTYTGRHGVVTATAVIPSLEPPKAVVSADPRHIALAQRLLSLNEDSFAIEQHTWAEPVHRAWQRRYWLHFRGVPKTSSMSHAQEVHSFSSFKASALRCSSCLLLCLMLRIVIETMRYRCALHI
jgi:hypothetical protein